ncbi:DUF115 domain-containing protein [Helicobacter aurati]|uniref:DUF115 domain-containing protein n=2 Tax=Helicobacter aurati TaxID=137778 RepID=A0A3D8J5Q3_9HELI|nr:DUF115 domain-containing protein [Helicobacter aurati]
MLQSVLHTLQDRSIDSCNDNADSSNKAQEELATIANTQAYNNLLTCFMDSKFLPQTTLYGLMGGIFLQDLLEQGFSFHSLIIYEEHIDLLRISLYFLDYQRLFESVKERSCLIIIKDIYPTIIKSFIATKRLTNNFLSLELKHYTSVQTQALQNLIMQEKKAAMRGWGSFEDEMIGFHNALNNLANCSILQRPKRVNAPICVVGNGASLDLCIDFIRAYQNKMIIFSCGTALKVLRHHGIKPDFQIEIERVPYLSQILQEANLGDIPLIFAQTTNCDAVTLTKQSFAFMRGGSASAYLDSKLSVLEFSAPFVGNAGVALAALLGSDVILCGIDCGYIKGYSKHAKNSFYGQETKEIPKDCFQVESNKNLEVYSNDLFYLSAKNIAHCIDLYKPNMVINLGYGAKITGALSYNDDEFSLRDINKPIAIQNLKKNFLPFELTLNNHEILQPTQELSMQISALLDTDVRNINDLYEVIDNVESLLQTLIAKHSLRKSIILFEGSILHLSFSLLLTNSFAGNMKYYDIITSYFKQGILAMIAHLTQHINKK